MSQRGVQLAIGKLVTDEEFRHRFEALGSECAAGLRQRGIDLNEIEMAALVETDPRVWSRMATWIDLRLLGSRSLTFEQARVRLRWQLTERQHRVLSGVCEGLSNKEIAAREGVSESAVKGSVQQLFRKLRARRRAQLVRFVIEDANATGSVSNHYLRS